MVLLLRKYRELDREEVLPPYNSFAFDSELKTNTTEEVKKFPEEVLKENLLFCAV